MPLNYKSKYAAFTLWEMLIAMLITSLIVSLSYGAYWKFNDSLNKDVDQSDRLQEITLLERDLYRITQSSRSIEREGDLLIFDLPVGSAYLEFSDSTLTLENEEALKGGPPNS